MTPSEHLIKELESEYIDELEYLVVIKKHKDGCVSYSGNRESKMDIYTLCNMVAAYTLSDVIARDIKQED